MASGTAAINSEADLAYQVAKGSLIGQWRAYENTGDLTYTLNSQGYRAKEFDQIDWNNSIVMLGCSCVLGVGVSDSETIAVHLERLSGIPVVNLGYGASSMAFSLYNQVALKEQRVKPRAVVNLWTSIGRLTYFAPDGPIQVGHWSDKISNFRLLFTAWNYHDSNPEIHAKFAQRMSHLLWEDVPYYEASFFDDTAVALGIPKLMFVDTGKDQKHPGPKTTEAVANFIYDNLKSKLITPKEQL